MENLSLRKAGAEDESFLRELFFELKGEEFSMMNLPFHQIESLLEMQYEAQSKSYEAQFPDAEHSIILIDDEPGGRMLIGRGDNDIHLIDILIQKNLRRKGIGKWALDKLKSGADKLSLSVYIGNAGAAKLYQREGFNAVENDGMYIKMEWKK
jgi:ribosomal protein S18 acetylase RimI-like enzyme